jgi:hypothetical protein
MIKHYKELLKNYHLQWDYSQDSYIYWLIKEEEKEEKEEREEKIQLDWLVSHCMKDRKVKVKKRWDVKDEIYLTDTWKFVLAKDITEEQEEKEELFANLLF